MKKVFLALTKKPPIKVGTGQKISDYLISCESSITSSLSGNKYGNKIDKDNESVWFISNFIYFMKLHEKQGSVVLSMSAKHRKAWKVDSAVIRIKSGAIIMVKVSTKFSHMTPSLNINIAFECSIDVGVFAIGLIQISCFSLVNHDYLQCTSSSLDLFHSLHGSFCF